jgi:hypothetical protein
MQLFPQPQQFNRAPASYPILYNIGRILAVPVLGDIGQWNVAAPF